MQNNFADLKKTRAEISLGAITKNFEYLKNTTTARVICVIKADAYGHGAVHVAKALEGVGADFFAVSSINEALELRDAGITSDILILGYILPEQLPFAFRNDFSVTCASLESAKNIIEKANGDKVKIHIKLNTGMNRTGFYMCKKQIPKELEELCKLLNDNKNIFVEGLYSHFAKAEDDKKFSYIQADNFNFAKEYILSKGINPEICHISNSAGTAFYNDLLFDAVRCGISLYGCGQLDENLVPSMSFKTTVVDIHTINKGDRVSYGLCFKAKSKTKIAVIGAGYADGIFRCLSNGKGSVLVGGKRAKIIGRVCMDMTMIDISGIENVKVGDEVVIFGFQGDAYISCDEQSKNAGTISYELLCGVSKRVPRIYTE